MAILSPQPARISPASHSDVHHEITMTFHGDLMVIVKEEMRKRVGEYDGHREEVKGYFPEDLGIIKRNLSQYVCSH